MVKLLNELNRKKLEYLQNIYKFSCEQKNVLLTDDIYELQRLIDKKQKVIEEINKIDQAIKQTNDKEETEYNEEIQSVLEKIHKIDQENKQLADKRFMEIKQKIGKIRRGKKVCNAYNPVLCQSAFLNKIR